MTVMMELVPSFTVTTPRKNIQNHKRSSSPASLDCRSLQTSLKRIRLSCSPGELRLQRDLSALGHFGWQQQQDNTAGSRTIGTGRTGGRSSTATNEGGADFPSHPPIWRQTNADLVLLDPLRLKLTCVGVAAANVTANDMYDDETTWSTTGSSATASTDICATTTTMWIQIPRMYPHRPPVISRADHSPTLFVVRDSPLGTLEDPSRPPPTHDPSEEQPVPLATAVMDWSPVRQIGDLLNFILEQLSISTLSAPTSSSTCFMENTTLAARPCSKAMAVSLSMNTAKPSILCSIQRQRQRQQQRSPLLNLFMLEDEHRMDEVSMVDDSAGAGGPGVASHEAAGEQGFLAPNRFDIGYGRYHDILATSSSSSSLQCLQHRPQHQQSQKEDPYAMEI